MNVFNKAVVMLGRDRRKLPAMAVLFVVMSLIDVVGIGLIGPFLKLVMDPVLQADNAYFLNGIFKSDIQEDWGVVIVAICLILFFLFKAFIGFCINSIIMVRQRQ